MRGKLGTALGTDELEEEKGGRKSRWGEGEGRLGHSFSGDLGDPLGELLRWWGQSCPHLREGPGLYVATPVIGWGGWPSLGKVALCLQHVQKPFILTGGLSSGLQCLLQPTPSLCVPYLLLHKKLAWDLAT